VVGNPAATVITSSHFFSCLSHNSLAVSAVIAKRLAELQELVVITCLIDKNSASFFSNISFHLPSVRWQCITASIIYSNSFSSKIFPETGMEDVHGINVVALDLISSLIAHFSPSSNIL
jgi:hypothetical protein